MTILRCRLIEGLPAEVAYALGLYALAACALALYLLLSQADAKPVTYAHGANSFTDPVALAAIPEPALLAPLGTSLLFAHLALRRRRHPPAIKSTKSMSDVELRSRRTWLSHSDLRLDWGARRLTQRPHGLIPLHAETWRRSP
jgi:hypothetical protein